MNRNIVKATALSVAAVPAAAAGAADRTPAQEPEQRPNIVVIIADDLLSSELGCYGGQNIETPNIDRLAREGVQFYHNYASEAMSVPIRASMYTGLYPAHHGSYQNHKNTFPGTRTVNEYMPEVGYRVGRTGKDHPGPKSVYKFDEIPGFTVGCTAKQAPYSTDGIREWMSRSDDPFLLFVCSINTHAPWTWGDPSEFDPDEIKVPGNCVDSPEMREIMTHYLAELRALDNEVGSVLQTLEEIGKLDNTIVFFLGEQGPQFPGGKWTLWNPGVSSALLARYPARIKPGSKSNAIVQYEDLLPTFIDIAGGEPRPELDGVSFKKALFGESKTARKYAYGIHNNYPEGRPYPIRSIRDERYALILNLTPEKDYHEKHLMAENNITGVWPAWKRAAETDERAAYLCDRFVHRPAVEFYDLKKDPWEMHNLAGEPKYQAKIAEMRAELEKWMKEQGDTGADMDIPFNNKIDLHQEAVLIKPGWIRDPYIVLGPDGTYYLTGTTPNENEPREQTDKFNTGLGDSSIVGNQLRIWKSSNLVEWEYLGSPYSTNDLPLKVNRSKGNGSRLWAPEIHWTGKNWVMVHCPSVVSTLAVTEGSDIMGPWKFTNLEAFNKRHDPSLFKDDDGKWYLAHGNGYVVPVNDGFSGVGEQVRIDPADRKIGHEGTTIMKIGGKYVFFGTAWSTDQGRKGSYNLYYCTADKITGPYSERRFVGRFLVHGTPFQDKQGRWWCTAFFNGNVPPLNPAGIENKDLSETAQTINKLGTTIVPLDVRILPDGDVYIRAIDPHYATPGPDEATPVPEMKL